MQRKQRSHLIQTEYLNVHDKDYSTHYILHHRYFYLRVIRAYGPWLLPDYKAKPGKCIESNSFAAVNLTLWTEEALIGRAIASLQDQVKLISLYGILSSQIQNMLQ